MNAGTQLDLPKALRGALNDAQPGMFNRLMLNFALVEMYSCGLAAVGKSETASAHVLNVSMWGSRCEKNGAIYGLIDL